MRLQRVMRTGAATLVAITGLLLVQVPLAHADVNDFVIESFTSDQKLTREDPQGLLHILETIKVNFTDNNHGILRAIPETYHGHPLLVSGIAVSSPSGAPAMFTASEQNGNLVLKIGDANRTVTGQQSYTITYDVHNVISFYKDHDELYWNVNGDQWDQVAEHVTMNLALPDGLKLSGNSPVCYAGSYGNNNAKCTISSDTHTVTASAPLLLNRETLTYVTGFSKGYFTPWTFWERVKDYLAQYQLVIFEIFFFPVIAMVIGLIMWLRYGRDPSGRKTIVPEYSAPDNVTPAQAGTILDFKLDNRDITATIIDLALRGYIKIVEQVQDRKILKDKTLYKLELRNTDFSKLTDYEQKLMNALFVQKTVGESVDINAQANKLFTTAKEMRKNLDDNLQTLGYFRKPPKARWILTAILVFGGVLIYLGHSPVLIIGGLLTAVIAYMFRSVLPSRTAAGVAAREKLLGLRLYISTAEADRIKMLQSPNAPYAANAGEPVKTVELFEKLLPFAIAMGVEKEWAKQFEHIYSQPPGWYSGSWSSFNTGLLVGNLTGGFEKSINTAFTAPRSSGSSGFGGGGFSGGGGGGGGGGGW